MRWNSHPLSDDRQREIDDAWERIKRLGLDPKDFFPE
jgi:hypothetical protein